MTNFQKIIAGLGALVVVVLVAVYLIPSTSVGGTVENYPTQWYNGLSAGHTKQLTIDANGKIVTSGGVTNTGSQTVGSAGTAVTQSINGFCNLIGTPTITATTTAAMDCAATGVAAGDRVFFTAPTTTVQTNLGWKLVYANASSTSGFITFGLQNLTGANAVPTSATTSSIQFLDIR